MASRQRNNNNNNRRRPNGENENDRRKRSFVIIGLPEHPCPDESVKATEDMTAALDIVRYLGIEDALTDDSVKRIGKGPRRSRNLLITLNDVMTRDLLLNRKHFLQNDRKTRQLRLEPAHSYPNNALNNNRYNQPTENVFYSHNEDDSWESNFPDDFHFTRNDESRGGSQTGNSYNMITWEPNVGENYSGNNSNRRARPPNFGENQSGNNLNRRNPPRSNFNQNQSSNNTNRRNRRQPVRSYNEDYHRDNLSSSATYNDDNYTQNEPSSSNNHHNNYDSQHRNGRFEGEDYNFVNTMRPRDYDFITPGQSYQGWN